MDFTRDELVWINNALNEVLGGARAIQEWEFHTIIGGDRSQVTALLDKIHEEIGVLRRADPES